MKVEDRNQIYRIYGNDVFNTMLSYHKKMGTEEAYLQYRHKFDNAMLSQYDRPLELVLELNNYCNMLCKMCYRNYFSPIKKSDMSDVLLDSVLLEARELQIPAIRIGAFAEASLRSDINDVLKKIGSRGFLDFWISTNGTQLNNIRLLDTLINIPVTHLCISIDAATAKTYKIIRGGDLNQLEDNIKLFLEYRKKNKYRLPILRVSFVDMPENRHEKQLFIDKWRDIADIVDIQSYVENNPIIMQKEKSENYNHNFSCNYPLKTLIVGHDGELKPCSNTLYHVSNPIYLGVDYKSINDYWNSDWHRTFSSRIALNHYEGICGECALRTNSTK